MMLAAVLNVIGLLANLAGVILLFRYGMPYRVRSEGVTHVITSSPPDQTDIADDKRYDRLGIVGLVLIILGTVAQIIATVLSACCSPA